MPIEKHVSSSLESPGVPSCSTLAFSAVHAPAFLSFAYINTPDLVLGFPIGGTQGLEINLVDFQVDPYAGTYSGKLEIIIYDDFGVDVNDRYTPPLAAFWVLQHVKEIPGNHRPFVNRIIVEKSISGTYPRPNFPVEPGEPEVP